MALAQPNNASLLNATARALLQAHAGKPVAQGWRYLAKVAIETICKTYAVSPVESTAALRDLMTGDRLAQFPHDDLFDLAHAIKFLGPAGDDIVLRLFEAAFDSEPKPGTWENFGSAILPMTIQTSDQWNSIHYSLAEYYASRGGDNAALMTEIACCAWNAVVRRREDRWDREVHILARIDFRGLQCELRQDFSHTWGRHFEPEENRILSRFEDLLRGWAAANDGVRIAAALDALARRNQTSLLWSLLMEVGAEYPEAVGLQVEPLLWDPVCLYHSDYAYAAAALMASLHQTGDPTRRERLERLIIALPTEVRSRMEHSWENGKPMSWLSRAQNRLLGGLQEDKIVSAEAKELWLARNNAGALPPNTQPQGSRVTAPSPYSDDEVIERRGISLKDPANAEMFRLREALRPFAETSAFFDVGNIERQWSLISESEEAVRPGCGGSPEMVQELWGYLVSACGKVAENAKWPKDSHRWTTVRRILLRASRDEVPEDDEANAKDDNVSGYGRPSPRIDAARALPRLLPLGDSDGEIAAAIRLLSHDGSAAVRFNLASVLPLLATAAPLLMWELIDSFVADETNLTVLDAVVHSLDWLWGESRDQVANRLSSIEKRVRQAAADHAIHETLAHCHLFQFLRTGRSESHKYIAGLIATCDQPAATKALLPLLHSCRVGGWMTAGDPGHSKPEVEAIRARTWGFLQDLLTTAHSKLQKARQRWIELNKSGKTDTPEIKEAHSEIQQTARLVDGISTQLYFASGAYADKPNNNVEEKLTDTQTQRFWREATPLLKTLTNEPHPHTAYEVVQTLRHLLPCDPQAVFLLAADSIRTSSTAGFPFESLAVSEVVKIVQRVFADHREILRAPTRTESVALTALLEVLDIFVEAGWPEARALTHRLEEVYR